MAKKLNKRNLFLYFYLLNIFSIPLYLQSFSTSCYAQDFTPYDKDLQRLAEILGSLHYLTNLCQKDTPSDQWRLTMQKILESEQAEQERRARLYEAFNHAYRAFAENYHQCTPMALRAKEFYEQQGAIITDKLLTRYSNVAQENF